MVLRCSDLVILTTVSAMRSPPKLDLLTTRSKNAFPPGKGCLNNDAPIWETPYMLLSSSLGCSQREDVWPFKILCICPILGSNDKGDPHSVIASIAIFRMENGDEIIISSVTS